MSILDKSRTSRRRRVILGLTVAATMILAWVPPTRAAASPGDLDTTFAAPNGFTTMPNAEFFGVAIQPADQKIVAVGHLGDNPAVVRYNTDGTLDSSFGTGGIASVITPVQVFGEAIALQPDGKIVAGCSTTFGQPGTGGDFFIIRFNPNGSIDTSFGQNGTLQLDLSDPLSFVRDELLIGLALASNGKIVIVGAGRDHLTGNDPRIALVRLESNGALDTTFGTGGIVQDLPMDSPTDVAVLADGRILVSAFGVVFSQSAFDLALIRYNNDGTLDTSFGGGGLASVNFPEFDLPRHIAVQPDGRIVLAGLTFTPSTDSAQSLWRFDSNGTLDTSFGQGGKAMSSLGGFSNATSVAIQTDGSIVVVGTFTTMLNASDIRTLLSRYTSNGSLDPTFGNSGNVFTFFPGFEGAFSGVAIQSDGKIVVVGPLLQTFPQRSGFVARYIGNGTTPPPPPPPPPSFDICLQNDMSNGGRLIFRFNSTTGAYDFHDCAKGTVLSGVGTLGSIGCKLSLNDLGPKPSDRNVSVMVNTCTKSATLSISIKSPSKMYGFTDSDITQGSCTCP